MKQDIEAPLLAPNFHWLGAALMLSAIPHFGHLPLWLTGGFIIALAWRWIVAIGRAPLPSRFVRLALTIGAGAGVMASFGGLLGRDPGVALLIAMSALKLLEARKSRDGVVLIYLGYLLVMSNLLYSQTLPTFAYLLISLHSILAAQISMNSGGAVIPPRILAKMSGKLLLQSVPFMLVLFVLFPRIPGPLWALPKDSHAKTGLSEEMSPGDISELSKSDAVAFRVKFDGEPPARNKLYWRAIVLWRYDGTKWSGGESPPRKELGYEPLAETIDYSVQIEPHGKPWLFSLDLPTGAPDESFMTQSYTLLSKKPVDEVRAYRVSSHVDYKTQGISAGEVRRATRMPREGDTKARELAESWRAQYEDDESVVNAALRYYREQPFVYTLNPPKLGRDRVDGFLFETQRGFCEFYASSFTYLMRAAGIPTRVVLGYQGGEFNEVGGYMIVRQSDAHAWAEVWLQDRGWIRVDPTAAVAPNRIEDGAYAAVSDPGSLGYMSRRDYPWLRNLAMSWDTVNSKWNEWVLAYGPELQKEFMAGLGFKNTDWRGLTILLGIALAILGGLYALRAWYRERKSGDVVTQTYTAFCAKLAKRGLERGANEGPLDYAIRIAESRPDIAEPVAQITQLYANIRYAENPEPDIRLLKKQVNEFQVKAA